MLTDQIAFAVHDLLHHIRRIQVTAVDAGGLRTNQSNGGHVKGLTEGIGRKGCRVIDQIGAADDALCLADHIHMGGFCQAKGLQILIIGFAADPLAHVDKGRVAGVTGGRFQILNAVTGFLGTADGPLAHFHRTGAVESGVHIHQSLFQNRCQRNGLEGGTGLIGGVNALVSPGCIHRVAFRCGNRCFISFFRLIAAAVLFDLSQLGIQLLLQGGIQNHTVLVGVIVGIGCHAQNGAGIDIHHDSGGTVGRIKLLQHALDALFQIGLHFHIDGKHQILSVLCIVVLLILIQHIVTGVILGANRQTCSSFQRTVVLGFQTNAALILGVNKANHIGRQTAVGIISLGVRIEPDALQLGRALLGIGLQNLLTLLVDGNQFISLFIDLAVDEAANLVSHSLLHLFLHFYILVINFFHPAFDFCLIHTGNPAQTPGNVALVTHLGCRVTLPLFRSFCSRFRNGLFLTLHIGCNILGRDIQTLCRSRNCQHISVPIQNAAAGGRDNHLTGLLVHSLALHLLMAINLQIIQFPEQQQKGHHTQQKHHQHRTAADDLIGTACGITFSAGIGGHARFLLGSV